MTKQWDKDTIRKSIQGQLRSVYIPSSVYRLQINSKFNFSKVRDVIPYLDELGVSAIYASPYFQAAKGSLHGYDVTDPNRFNPEIGTEQDYDNMIHVMKKHKLTQIMDLVPNHMGIADGENQWWRDLLENGQASIYEDFFDVDWNPEKKELKGKVLLPVLGEQYGSILEKQELKLHFEEGQFFIRYWDHRFPVAPDTYPSILEHQIQDLRDDVGNDHRDILELLSISTSFGHLPSREEGQSEKVYERNREKEISKTRLAELVGRSQVVQKFVLSRVEIFNGVQGESQSFDLLDQLLEAQSYRLSFWRVAAHEINYRRFFDVNELAAIRNEKPHVFDASHWLAFHLISEGKVHGLRLDHPDGLYHPENYFKRLQTKYLTQNVLKEMDPQWDARQPADENLTTEIESIVEECLEESAQEGLVPFFVVLEKILDRKEQLPRDWRVSGTVGYDYLNLLNGLFVDADQEKAFNKLYQKFIGEKLNYDSLVYDKKKLFAAFYMSSELNSLGYRLDQISENNRLYRDFTWNDLVTAIREIIACFPVYRTYISPLDEKISERDERYIRIAIEKAKGKHPAISETIFDFLLEVLLLRLEHSEGSIEKVYRDFILRFQQLTAPIMAKGMEDTVFYLYNRLISLCEVGGDPEHFGVARGDFHRSNMERNRHWFASFLPTSTHDAKRSEDVRMRINVLSEIPDEWNSQISKWTRLNKKYKKLVKGNLSPGRNEEYFIYQTLLGAFPDEDFQTEAVRKEFLGRIYAYLDKAGREAKLHTSWLNPNEEYESAVRYFVENIMTASEDNKFLEDFISFQQKVSKLGKWNSLSSLILKQASPGVVDTYQGNEMWDYSLVDPDNRRPVDFKKRAKLLSEVKSLVKTRGPLHKTVKSLLGTVGDSRAKLYLLWKGLHFRKENSDILIGADYHPLEVAGTQQKNLVAFSRTNGDRLLITASLRFFNTLCDTENQKYDWNERLEKDLLIRLPQGTDGKTFEDLYSGNKWKVQSDSEGPYLKAHELFATLPGVMLTESA